MSREIKLVILHGVSKCGKTTVIKQLHEEIANGNCPPENDFNIARVARRNEKGVGDVAGDGEAVA